MQFMLKDPFFVTMLIVLALCLVGLVFMFYCATKCSKYEPDNVKIESDNLFPSGSVFMGTNDLSTEETVDMHQKHHDTLHGDIWCEQLDRKSMAEHLSGNKITQEEFNRLYIGEMNPHESEVIVPDDEVMKRAKKVFEQKTEEIDEEELCEFCQKNVIHGPAMTYHFMCEGSRCDDAREMYLESKENDE